MGQHILLFESDPAFASQVRGGFEALGATVDVAHDGQQGIDLAAAHKPDLILLSIELPGMNGFLVCKKLKKQDQLQDVPLLILSSEATEDVFEQHKKLRTRAEDYLHKPIAFSDLLERVKQFVAIESNGVGEASAEDEVEIADLDEEEVILVADESQPPEAMAATETDVFAEEALDALIADDRPGPAAPPLFSGPSASTGLEEHRPAHRVTTSAVDDDGSGLITGVTASADVTAEELSRTQRELQQAGDRVAELQAALADAEARARSAEQELQVAKQRVASAERAVAEAGKKGGVSSREFLDLREQLNRKDRELLALRDQVSSRDKQLIEQSDKSLMAERQLADQSDKNLDLQRELEKNRELIDSLQADKDGAKKRLDDLKARLERSEAKNRELSEELGGIKGAHAKELDALQQRQAEANAVQVARHAEAIDELRREQVAVAEALRRAHADELSELREEHAVALVAAHEAAEQQKQTACDALRVELEANAEQRVVQMQKEHESVVSQALAAHENELSSMRQGLQDKHAAEMRQSAERYQQELARVGRALAELETKQQLLEDQLEEAESAKADAHARLGRITVERDQKAEQAEELQAQLDHLVAERADEEQVLDRVRKALAIGLSLLEEHKRGGLDEQAES